MLSVALTQSIRMRFAAMGLGLALCAGQARAQAAPISKSSAHIAPSASAPQKSIPETTEFAVDIEAEKITFAVNVSSRIPVGASDVFDADVGEVYCWNQLILSRVPATIRHEWYWDDKKISESVFRARFNRTRVWSKRKVRPGRWRVEIKDEDSGRLIAVGAFVVRKS